MRKFDDLVEDFSRRPVPLTHTVSGARIALIMVGISIALPGFLAGAQIGQTVGFQQSMTAFFAAGVILAAVGVMTSVVASRARLSTYMLVQLPFGTKGAKVVNFFLASTLFGWFGVNASLFGDAMIATLQTMGWWSAPAAVYVVIGSALMVATTIFGFKALDKLSLFAVPLLFIILVGILSISLGRTDLDDLLAAGDRAMPLGLTISAVAGGNMVAVTTLPDLTRYLANGRQAVTAMFYAYVLGMPIILLSVAVPSLVSGESDLMKIILGLGLGLPALLVLIFSTWTSNAANLYSSGLSLAAVFTGIHRWKLTVMGGAFGIGIAVAGIVEAFVPFLIALSVVIPPIAGIYVTYFFLAKGAYNLDDLENAPAVGYPAFAAWMTGSGVAFLAVKEVITITGIPALDSIFVAAGIYWLLQRLLSSAPLKPAPGDKLL